MAVNATKYYRTVGDADAYFTDQLYADDWLGATEADKEKALLAATRAVDRLKFKGVKNSLYEALVADGGENGTCGDVLLGTTNLTATEIAAADALQLLQFPRDEQVTTEVFSVTVDATGGTFDIVFNGETASAIAFDATTGTVQTALEGLASVTAGDIVVTGTAGAYVITTAGNLLKTNGNTLTTVVASLAGGTQTADVLTTADAIPDPIFWGICEEAKNLLSGIDPQQCFENLVLTSDGVGSNRISSDRSQMPPLHISHFITSAPAWQFLQPYLSTDANNFSHNRVS